MKKIFLLAIILLFPALALATDRRCGVDTDLDGDVDVACPSPDTDGDGYATDGTGRLSGIDCDESGTTGYYIYPGISTSIGCSAGNYHTCQADGTFTSCAPTSGFTCHTTGGSTYFVDDAETDCSGDGSYPDPEDYRCWSNSGMSGYHAATDDDCVAAFAGTYTATYGSSPNIKQFEITAAGTSGNPIHWEVVPGSRWWEVGVGNGATISGTQGSFIAEGNFTEVVAMHFGGTHYTAVSNFEIKTNGGFTNSGIHVDDAALHVEVYNNYIHDIDGQEDNNLACMKFRGGSNYANIHHNFMKDCYERFATTGDAGWNSGNNSEFRSMDNDEMWVHDNIAINTNSASDGISFKHGIDGAVGNLVEANIIIGTGQSGIITDAIPNTIIRDNYLYDTAQSSQPGAIAILNLGGTGNEIKNITIEYNTIELSGAFFAINETPDTVTGNMWTYRYNVVSDDTVTYSTDNSANGFYHVGGYGTDSTRTAVLAQAVSDYNCYYNSVPTTLRFSFFEATSGGWGPAGAAGQAYSGLAAWQAIFDTHSYLENPSFSSARIATSTNCTGKGWRLLGVNTGGGGSGGGGISAPGRVSKVRMRVRSR